MPAYLDKCGTFNPAECKHRAYSPWLAPRPTVRWIALDDSGNPEAGTGPPMWTWRRLTGGCCSSRGGVDDLVDPGHILRLADRLGAADRDVELLIAPGPSTCSSAV
jgi:hypothetical protein